MALRLWERKGHRRPVRLIERNLPRQILLGHYGAADAVLATTEIDGQMLIPYEALLSGREDIYVALGKGAGASHILKDYTTLVDGADPHDVAYAIIESHRMSSAEKIARVVAAREYIGKNDVQTWARNYYTEFKKTAR